MKRLINKAEIVYGKDALSVLSELNFKQVCITTDRQMIELGLIDQVTSRLEQAGIRYKIFSDVVPDPTTDQVHSGLHHIIETKPDCLIALGGGSTLDTAKAVMYSCIRMKEKLIESYKVEKPFFIAIPTTSGTGSEVSSYAVVTDAGTQQKMPIHSDLMLPDMAILDPELTRSIPRRITAETAMDALTHAMEAWVATNANPFSDAYVLQAVKLIYDNVLSAFHDGNNLEARINLHIASCMAGIAFNSSGLGITHSLAHVIGAKFHIPHGRINGIILPYGMTYNMEKQSVVEKYGQMAVYLGLTTGSDEQRASGLVQSINLLKEKTGLPATLGDAGVNSDQISAYLSEIIPAVLQDICTMTNPREVKPDDIIGLVKNLL